MSLFPGLVLVVSLCLCIASSLSITISTSPPDPDECSPPDHEYPVCSPRYHNITIPEDLKKKTNVLQLNCSDPEGSKLKWKLASGNSKRFFSITQTGMLQTKKKLDAEAKINPYLLHIEAWDSGTPSLTATVVITIFMSSINDEPPLMLQLPQEVEASENSLRGSLVVWCSLLDKDSARLPEGLARVRILEGNDDNLFQLDSKTCALTLNERLDYETMEPRRLLYEAYELDVAAPLTTKQNVTIIITDYNDHPPNCTENVILLSVSEDTVPDTLLTSLNCSDVDVSDTLRYEIKEGSADALAVNATTGEVTLANPVDFESDVTNFDVIVIVYDISSHPFTTTVIVNVQVLDADDSIPQIDSDVIHIEVGEKWEVGRVVWTLTARDEDTPGTPLSTVTFTGLPSSSAVDWFHVHPETGSVTIQTVMDRETEHNVGLTVVAHSSDRHWANSTVLLNITIIDVNDNRPVFNQTFYRTTVTEEAAFATVVRDIMATDADGDDVIFSSDSDCFSVESNAGEVVLTCSLDFETLTSYEFVVTATDDDGAMTSQAMVKVEVSGTNEAPPTFQVPANDSEVRLVAEDTLPGTSLFSLSASDADDGDDGQVTYHLLQPADSPFLLDLTGGDVTLRSKLDRETRDTFLLVVEARDSSPSDVMSSSVTLTVSVTDVNDNGPVCLHLDPFLVNSSVAVGETILALLCHDDDLVDSGMTFVKVSGDASGVFRVDAVSGEIKLMRAPTLSEYEILIQVQDAGSARLSCYTTVVFMTEESFAFGSLADVVELTEDVEVGTVVLDLDTTGSRLPSFFQLDSGSGGFTIQPSTGEVHLTSTLDRETKDKHELTVVAFTSAGHSVTATVTVMVADINDNTPVVSGSFNVSVTEDVAVPTTLQVFSAQDDDLDQNGQVTFQIVSGNEEGRFLLTADGTLSVVQALDTETQQFYQLVIRAADGGSPSLTSEKTVIVTVVGVDEFQPQFAVAGQNTSLHISEDAAVGVVVVHVTADDADLADDVRLDLISGNSKDTFRIDRSTGQLFLARLLDREKDPEFNIVVQISNAKQEDDTTMITIILDDVNDNAPTFSQTQYIYDVTSNTPANTKIADLSAWDRDEGVNADFLMEIVSGDTDIFQLDGASLMTNQTINITEARSYTLTVRATDKGSPAMSTDTDVFIRVIPFNEPPQFLFSEANITIEENSLTGLKIYDFQATWAGASEGDPGDIIYTIASGNNDLRFHMDEVTGDLYLIRDLDYEENSIHALSVRAQHRLDDGLFDVMDFMIYVTNVNDVSPKFQRLAYTWELEEDDYEGAVLGTVIATDDDDGPFGQVSYSMSSDAMFAISATTGEVTVTGHIDYNQRSYFYLSLTATDDAGSASMTGRAAIMVHVIDVNDHVPEFPDVGGDVTVSESAPARSVVVPLLPRDEDHGDNARLNCDIVLGNEEGKFDLDPDTCVLTISDNLDAESETLYELVVTATDAGSPALTGTTSLTVRVKDENDNTPRFPNSTAHVHLARSAPPRTEVYEAAATDADSGRNGMVFYSFLSGNAGGVFSLDPHTGEVRTLAALTLADDAYTMLVTATDRGYPARTATLTLSVDVFPALLPSTPSSLTFVVPEHSPVGTVAGVVPSDDSRDVLSHAITSGNFRHAFRVKTGDNGDGVVEVARDTDRELYSTYQIVVETRSVDVLGTAVTDPTVVTVEISDVNDHAPVFSDPGLAFSVVENLAVGISVARLEVSDQDEGLNADVSLSFAAAGYVDVCDTYFALTSDGDIVIKEPLDYESLGQVTCQVTAEDKGSTPRRTTSSFTATVIDVPEEQEQQLVVGESASVFLSLEFPFDSSSGRLVHTLSALHFGIVLSPGDALSFLSLDPDGVFAVATETGEVRLDREDLLYDRSRYFQWVACQYRTGAGGLVTQLGMLRVDTFSMDQHVVVLSLEASAEYVESKRAILQSRLQTHFGSQSRLEILEIRGEDGTSARRRLLNQQTVALVYVVTDTSADSVGGVDNDKTFMTQSDVLKVLQVSSDGTPVDGVSDSTLPVIMVMPYHNDPEADSEDFLQTAQGLAVILVVIGLVVIVAIFLFVCCLWRLHRKNRRERQDSLCLLRSDSFTSERDQDSAVSTPQKDTENDSVSMIAEPDPQPNLKNRRLTLVIKEELDRLLPFPLMMSLRPPPEQTPPIATGITPSSTVPAPADPVPPALQKKQATLNRLIEEKRDKVKGKKKGKASSSGVPVSRSQSLLVSEKTDSVDDLKDKPDSSTAQASPRSSAPMDQSPSKNEPSSVLLDVETLTSSPVLTPRAVHRKPSQAWGTNQQSVGNTGEGKNQTAESKAADEPMKSTSSKFRVLSSVFSSLRGKQSSRGALPNKRASMPAAISDVERTRLSKLADAATSQEPHKTAGAQLTNTDERDIALLRLKEGTVVKRTDRPQNISTVRRQSLFV